MRSIHGSCYRGYFYPPWADGHLEVRVLYSPPLHTDTDLRHSWAMSYDELLAETQAEFPTFRVVPKAESKFMSFLAILLGWMGNDTFMYAFTTTIGFVVYTPSLWEESFSDTQKYQILLHERVHMRQAKRYGVIWFSLLYLLVPLPFVRAYYRTKFEQEAYYVSMRSRAAIHGIKYIEGGDYRTNMIHHFTGPDYGWMWTNRKDIEEWYDTSVEKIRKELGLS